VTKERSEVTAYTKPLGFSRWGRQVYLHYSQCIGIYSFREKRFSSPKIFFLYKLLSWQENKIDAGNDFHLSFCLSLITNSKLKLNTSYLISNCNTHNSIFTLSCVSGLNINSTLFTIIFNEDTIRNTMCSELHCDSSKFLRLTYIQLHRSEIRLNSVGPYQ
jgi:hypothetical protein